MGIAKVPVLSKRLNIITEQLPITEAVDGVEAIASYETSKQGENRLTIGLQNGTGKKIVINNGTKVTQVATAYVVLPMFMPDLSTVGSELKYVD